LSAQVLTKEYFLPIINKEAVRFLKSSRFTERMNVILSYTDPRALLDTLHGDKDLTKRVFGKKDHPELQVARFFLQLIANGILVFRLVKKQPKVLLMRNINDDFLHESVLIGKVSFSGIDPEYLHILLGIS
jgi:hypothetical protein